MQFDENTSKGSRSISDNDFFLLHVNYKTLLEQVFKKIHEVVSAVRLYSTFLIP